MAHHSIHPAEATDMAEIANIIYRSQIPDGIQQYVGATWPRLETEAGRAEACKRMAGIQAHLPNPTQFLKVVDDRTGAPVAFSICFFNDSPPKMTSGLTETVWETEEDREYASDLKRDRDALLLRTMARFKQGEPVTEILGFFVDDSQQHQGVGKFLMHHLISLHKPRKTPLVLIASPTAVKFYEKQGFRIVEDRELEVPEKWSARPPARLVAMDFEH